MVKSIQVFRYFYAPSIATAREKVGTKKTIKRRLSIMHEVNVNELTELQTIIKNVETYGDGVIGKVEHQYIVPIKTGDGEKEYRDFWDYYYFYISQKIKMIILMGTGDHRNTVKNILSDFFNNERNHITSITIPKKEMHALVNKIKIQGPKKDGKYKNMMKFVDWDFPDKSSYNGTSDEKTNQFDGDMPICVSDTSHFQEKYDACTQFGTKMRLFKCNGILNDAVIDETILTITANAEFQYGKDPTPEEWIIFVTQTCKTSLNLS